MTYITFVFFVLLYSVLQILCFFYLGDIFMNYFIVTKMRISNNKNTL